MKKKILNNFSLKILSAICAIILWGVIVNIYDPSTSFTVSGVSVQLLNEQELTDKGYTYEVVDGSKISVYVSGPRSIVSDIKSSDIVATADLSDISAFADYVDIDVKVVKDGISTSALEVTPKTTAIKLDIENREIQTYDIELEITGTPASGYTISDKRISPTTVKITGASSAIANIDKVKAIYDVSGASLNISNNATIQLYDVAGNVISDDRIELNRTEVEVRATLQASKTVAINYNSTGTVASGYSLTGIEHSKTEAVISGEDSLLKNISSIDIPASAIDVSGLNADKEYAIKISKYLPDGVRLISEDSVSAVAKVSASIDKEFVVTVSDIGITNLGSGYKVEVGNSTTFSIIINGASSVVNSINTSSLKPVINLSGLSAGTSNVNIAFTLPTGCRLKQDYYVPVTILNGQSQENESTTAATVK